MHILVLANMYLQSTGIPYNYLNPVQGTQHTIPYHNDNSGQYVAIYRGLIPKTISVLSV